ncbi:STS14 protein-like protein [Corchorus olitorius]|uniref:STS14 protein-like protein n=1 Tax=Corchorus olitorius TaxID=93759 RepID=A0A1R3KLP4_9ROSI|nr:STS14 protein-like protein [Corchorus olitorius]
MLGLQADMQPKRQILGRYTARDLNLDANETVRPEDNINGFLRNRQYYNEAKNSTLPLHSYDKNRGQTVHNPSRIPCSSIVPELLETNCKRIGKKILDLELPAEEYIDSEEEEFSAVKMTLHFSNILLQNTPRISSMLCL